MQSVEKCELRQWQSVKHITSGVMLTTHNLPCQVRQTRLFFLPPLFFLSFFFLCLAKVTGACCLRLFVVYKPYLIIIASILVCVKRFGKWERFEMAFLFFFFLKKSTSVHHRLFTHLRLTPFPLSIPCGQSFFAFTKKNKGKRIIRQSF